MQRILGTCLDCQGYSKNPWTNICEDCEFRRGQLIIRNVSTPTYRRFMQTAPNHPDRRTFYV